MKSFDCFQAETSYFLNIPVQLTTSISLLCPIVPITLPHNMHRLALLSRCNNTIYLFCLKKSSPCHSSSSLYLISNFHHDNDNICLFPFLCQLHLIDCGYCYCCCCGYHRCLKPHHHRWWSQVVIIAIIYNCQSHISSNNRRTPTYSTVLSNKSPSNGIILDTNDDSPSYDRPTRHFISRSKTRYRR